MAERAHVCLEFCAVIGRLSTRACALKLDCTQGGGYFVQSVLPVSRLSARAQWILPCVCECVSCRYSDCRQASRQAARQKGAAVGSRAHSTPRSSEDQQQWPSFLPTYLPTGVERS